MSIPFHQAIEGLPWLQELHADFHRGIEEGLHTVLHELAPPAPVPIGLVPVFRYIRQAAIVRAWASLEALAEDIWTNVSPNKGPPMAMRSTKGIVAAYSAPHFDLGAPPFADQEQLHVVELMRHVFVHRGGYVDQRYLERLAELETKVEARWAEDIARRTGKRMEAGFSKPAFDFFRRDVGEPLDVEVDYAHSYINEIGTEGSRLIKLVGYAVKRLPVPPDYQPA